MTVSASEASVPRSNPGVASAMPASGATSGAASATAPGAPTAAGMLGASTEAPPLPASNSDLQPPDPSGSLPQLRTPEGRLPPGAEMVALQALISRFTDVMTDMSNRAIDTLAAVKKEQTDEYLKKIEDLSRKLRAAMSSWLNKLPRWLSSAVTAIGVCLMAAMAIGATAASGGAAAAPAMAALAAFLALAGITSLTEALGTIGWNLTGHEGGFGFEALEKSGILPDGAGRAIDAFLKADIPGGITQVVDAAGTDNARTLMIVSVVLTVVTAIATISTLMALTPSKAVAASALFKGAQVGNNITQVLQGVVSGAQAGVTANEVKNETAAIRSQADVDVARLTLEVTVDGLLRAIKQASVYFESYQRATDAVREVLLSEQRTASELAVQSA